MPRQEIDSALTRNLEKRVSLRHVGGRKRESECVPSKNPALSNPDPPPFTTLKSVRFLRPRANSRRCLLIGTARARAHYHGNVFCIASFQLGRASRVQVEATASETN